jgi:hypothetical protein
MKGKTAKTTKKASSQKEISSKQKEAISEIYLLCIGSADIHLKLSFLTMLYSAIRSALVSTGKVQIVMVYNREKQKSVPKIMKEDEFNSADKLIKTKNYLYKAYESFSRRDTWIAAEQYAIEISENLSELAFVHEFIDVDSERWSATYHLISPGGKGSGDDDDD